MAVRVGVIGAGASGLAALRHLLKKPDIFQPLAFEKLSGVGGLWIYTDVDDQRLEDRTVHSSIYKNMTYVYCTPYANDFCDLCLSNLFVCPCSCVSIESEIQIKLKRFPDSCRQIDLDEIKKGYT